MAKGKRTALITGITGQDGSYLAELLLAKGYVVYGVIRRSSTFNIDRIEHLYQDPHARDYRLRLVYGNLTDASRITQLLAEIRPDEIYNLGAQSHVKVSFEQPEYTGDVDAAGVTRLLESVRSLGLKSRIYQACSSEMFGNAPAPQSEDTAMLPRSPYAAAKAYAYWMCRTYREAYGLFIANGILFNHESPRRGPTFVTRKIPSSRARSRARSRRSRPASRTAYFSAISTRCAIGATRATMSRGCGACCSTSGPMTSCWPRVKATACASSVSWPLRA